MSFSIELSRENVLDSESVSEGRSGLITIGPFQERFVAPLDYWTASDYERHWVHAISRLLDTSDRSCLVTSMHDPETANFIEWWPLYRIANTVFIQHHLLFLDALVIPLNPNDLFPLVPQRRTVNEDGDPISEWQVPIEDLAGFLHQAQRPIINKK